MRTARIVLLTLLTLAALGLGAAFAVVGFGLYDVAATQQHFRPVHWLLEHTMRQSVRLRARQVRAPPRLDDPQLLVRGAACFRDKCVQCHGAPGVAQAPIGQSMQPLPGPLVDAMQHWTPREVYWLTRHGIRMSGMPAWQYHLADEDIWAVAAFVQKLPALSPQDYAALTTVEAATACPSPSTSSTTGPAEATRVPDVRRGKLALTQHACHACHTIPGIPGSSPQVGPPLEGIAGRTLIAGRLAHTPENMVRWITRTHEVDPRSAMPQLGVTEADARDMAAYLATLN